MGEANSHYFYDSKCLSGMETEVSNYYIPQSGGLELLEREATVSQISVVLTDFRERLMYATVGIALESFINPYLCETI
jgi:hypothetical protein